VAGSLDKRIEALERLYAMGESPDPTEMDLEERRAALRESMQRGWGRAEAEAAAGDTRRLHALQDLERSMRERVERRLERRLVRERRKNRPQSR
jgi:hypothetical protein